MTVLLLVANVVVFWVELSLGRQLDRFLERWGLVPVALAAALEGESSQIGVLITPLSAMFVHVGWLHLLGNLLYLWAFGHGVEAALGWPRFLALYLVAGCAAGLAQVLVTPTSTVPAVGASGAIAGLLGAYVCLRLWQVPPLTPSRQGDLLAITLLGLWVAALVLGGILEVARPDPGPGPFSWWGHLGGLVAGMILVSLYRYTRHVLPGAK